MNIVKIALVLKRKFSEFYDIKHYKKQSLNQFIVKEYTINNQEITVKEE